MLDATLFLQPAVPKDHLSVTVWVTVTFLFLFFLHVYIVEREEHHHLIRKVGKKSPILQKSPVYKTLLGPNSEAVMQFCQSKKLSYKI